MKQVGKKIQERCFKFNHVWNDDDYRSGANVYYNDAGKIYIDTNGKESGLITKVNKASINSQVVAFVDPACPSTNDFLGVAFFFC